MSDPFAGSVDGVSAPATRAVPVVPGDAALAVVPKALFVGSAGDVVARGLHDTADAVFRNVAAGSVLPFRARIVRAAGTTAGDILALY